MFAKSASDSGQCALHGWAMIYAVLSTLCQGLSLILPVEYGEDENSSVVVVR